MEPQILNVEEKQKVAYCIPLWLRDEQIKLNLGRCKGRIEAGLVKIDEPIALVNFGPSLNDTWEQIKNFKHVFSCSGAHKFLVDRGIIPTHHADVDPREHKVKLIGEPQHGTQYLIASTCHPKLFEHLAGYDVKLWHIFDNEDEALRVLPRGEWAITGGCSAGVRLLTLARFLGFTEHHIFGMDGCEGASGKHAAEHPNQSKGHCLTEYEGVTYRTTPAMLEAARQTWHELDMLKDVNATFYGEGLVQAMAKKYQRKVPKLDPLIAFNRPPTITEEYRALNAKLHVENLAYGVGGGKYKDTVIKLVEANNLKSVLDYGCGKGYLAKALPFPIWEYDPAIEGKQESPKPADLVICTDVLEHIEPELLRTVLDDIRRCLKQVGYFTIHTGPALKFLPDGRNTHLIQRDKKWWSAKLSAFFTVGKILQNGPELHVVVGPQKQAKDKAA